MGDLIDD